MPNVLTQIVPVLLAQGLQILRGTTVMPRLVNNDFANTPSQKGDTINVWIPSAATVEDVAPSAAPYQAPDSSGIKVPIQLNRWRHSGFFLTDKEQEEIAAGYKSRKAEEAVKVLANDVNGFLLSQYTKIFGFVGTPGTTPFASDVTAATGARATLNRQLAPLSDRRFIMDVNAEANALGLAQFTSAEKVGSNTAIIEGTLGRRLGFDFAMDQQVPTHVSTPLTAGNATVNGAQAAGAGSTDGGRTGTVSIAKATNASNLVAGDIITFAGDAQTYTVLASTTLIVGNTSVSIAPALQSAKAGGEVMSLKATHVVNLAMHRDCIAFASRPLQAAKDNTVEMMSVADPISGIALRLEVTRQNKQWLWDFDILYGGQCVRPELGVRVAG
ncbi:MAG: hypothetical protein K2Y26_00185 [Gemmatimonadaceae bacterium]|nr:hypothetical protein [Gemmatimonadaceae bacterium]